MTDRTQRLLNCIHDIGAPTVQAELAEYDESAGTPFDQKLLALHRIVLAGFSIAEIEGVLASQGIIDPAARLFRINENRPVDRPGPGSNSKWVHRSRLRIYTKIRRVGVDAMRTLIARVHAEGHDTVSVGYTIRNGAFRSDIRTLNAAVERFARWQTDLEIAREAKVA